MKILGISLMLVWLWAVPPAAGAEGSAVPDLTQLSLEELLEIPVSGASRYEQREAQVPAAVTVITQREIKKYGYRTLAEILRSIPGLYLTFDRNYHYLGVRGFSFLGDYNTRLLLLIDGHRLNDAVYGQAPIGTDFPLDVDLIERVEVIKGPGSVMYGGNAFFAVIQVVTRKGGDLKGLEVSPELGLYTYKGRLSYGKQWPNGWEALQSVSFYDSRGMRRYEVPGREVAFDGDYDRFFSYFSKVACQGFTFTGAAHYRKKGFPTGAWGTITDKDNQTIDVRAFADLKYQRQVFQNGQLAARLYYDLYDYRGTYVFDYSDPADPPLVVKNRDFGRGMRWGGELQFTQKLGKRHQLVVGGEFYHNFEVYQKNYDESPRQVYVEDKRRSHVLAGFAQDEITLLPNLTFLVGGRFDHYSHLGSNFSPRLALIYQPFSATNLKLVYGQAFRPPNAYELYYQDNAAQRANPSLRAEQIRSLELVWEQRLGKGWRWRASGFGYRIKDPIVLQDQPGGFTQFVNRSAIEGKGLELELTGSWRKALEGRLSYSLHRVSDSSGGHRLPNSPLHVAKAHLLAPLYRDKVFAGVEALYGSRRLTLAGRKTPGEFTANLTLFSRQVIPGLELSASVYNLFNRKIDYPGSEEHLLGGADRLRQEGRTFRLKLQYTF